MPLKIVKTENFIGDGDITKEQIQQLHDRYAGNTGKMKKEAGKYDDFDKKKHSRCGWFPLSEIMAFLKDNGVDLSPGSDISKYGVRIYFGQHHEDNDYQPKPKTVAVEKYHNQDTPILVLTRYESGVNADQLDPSHLISLSPFAAGDGQDNAKLCPPECDGGEKIS